MSQYDENKKIWYCKNGLPATTLYLQYIRSRLDQVFEHFSAFGVVTNVSIHGTPTNCFGYVTFGDATSAAKALVMKFHTIGSQQTEVTIADADTAYRGSQLTNELNDRTATKFFNLNDDCLHEVFSLLNREDLITVARTCTRFKVIANRVFAHVHKALDLRDLRDLREMSLKKYHEARRVLITSGMLISEIQVESCRYTYDIDYDIDLLDLIARCCTNTFDSLILNFFYIAAIPKWLAIKLKPLFNKLKKLHLIHCDIESDNSELFADCDSLVDLKILFKREMGESEKKLLKKTYLTLERLHLEIVFPGQLDDQIEIEILENFIARHKNLKSLSIWNCSSSILKTIADNCKRLDELQFSFYNNIIEYEGFKRFSTLNYLRKLKIKFNFQNFITFSKQLKDLKSLECLELEMIEANPVMIPPLLQLNKLQVLRFINCIRVPFNELGNLNQLTELAIIERDSYTDVTDSDVVALIKRLVNLTCLHLTYFTLHSETFFKIVDVIQQRGTTAKQIFRVKCYRTDVQSPEANNKFVKIIRVSDK